MRRLSDISPKLRDRLDSSIPCWDDLIDKKQLLEVCDIGLFNEEWLLDHLKNRAWDLTYKIVDAKSRELFSRFTSGEDYSWKDLMEEFSDFATSNSEQLRQTREEIQKIYFEFHPEWKDRYVIKEKKDVVKSAARVKEQIKQSTESYNKEVFSNTEARLIESVRNFDAAQVEQMALFFQGAFQKLKDSNKETEVRVNNVVDVIAGVMNEKFLASEGDGILNRNFEDVDFTPDEEIKIEREMQKVVTAEVQDQQRIRTEMVNDILFRLMGVSNSEELIALIDACKFLWEEHKRVLKIVIKYGYVSLIRGAKISASGALGKIQGCFKGGLASIIDPMDVYEILVHLKFIEDVRDKHVEKVFSEDKIYHFCNGGWWAPLSHLATVGMCSSYTIGANIGAWIWRRSMDVKSVILAVETIFFVFSTPFRLAALTVKGVLGVVAKRVLSEALCSMSKSALDYLSDQTASVLV